MIRSVFWRPLDEIGLEHLHFETAADALRAAGTGFSADLPIDADGLIMDYPGLFERVGGTIAA